LCFICGPPLEGHIMRYSPRTLSVRAHHVLTHHGWFRGSAVERWSLTGELSVSCARPTADG